MDLEPFIAQMDLYLTDRLSEEDRVAFEQALSQSEELQTGLQNRQLERQAMQTLVKQEYKDQIREWMPPLDSFQKEADRQKKAEAVYMWIAAASVIIMLLSVIAGFWKSDSIPYQDLIAEHYQKPIKELNNIPRGEPNQASEQEFRKAREAFLNQEYEKAIGLWSTFPMSDEGAIYFLAHSYFLNGEYKQALDAFAAVADLGGRYEEKSELYQLICYLALNQTDDAFQSFLTVIAEDADHSFQANAKDIQAKLEEN